MSADNWTKCPRCDQGEAARIAKLQRELDEAYGKVAIHVYKEMVARFETERGRAEIKQSLDRNTFREDYEIYGAETGVLTVEYSGRCAICGLRLSFKEEHPFYPEPAVEMSTDFPGTPRGRGDTVTIITADGSVSEL